MLVRFFKKSYASQYTAAGLTGVVLWASVLPAPPVMPEPQGPVILYRLLFSLLQGLPVVASLSGMALMLASAFWLNRLLTTHEIVQKKSSLAVFIYVLLSCWHPAQMTLTPVGIITPLLLWVLNELLLAYNRAEPVDLTFSAGFLISVSSLFFLPAILFYGFLLTAFIVYRSVKWREWAGSFIGLLTPFLFLLVYRFWTDQLPQVFTEYATFFRQLSLSNPWHTTSAMVPLLFLLLFFLAGISHNFSHLTERTVEIRKKMILFNWLAVWILLCAPFSGPLLFYLPGAIVIVIVPQVTNLYLARRKILVWEMALWIFILIVIINQFLNSFA